MTTSSNTKSTLSVVDSEPGEKTDVPDNESGDDSLTPAGAAVAESEIEYDVVIAPMSLDAASQLQGQLDLAGTDVEEQGVGTEAAAGDARVDDPVA